MLGSAARSGIRLIKGSRPHLYAVLVTLGDTTCSIPGCGGVALASLFKHQVLRGESALTTLADRFLASRSRLIREIQSTSDGIRGYL